MIYFHAAVSNQAYSSSDAIIAFNQPNQAYTTLANQGITSNQYKSLKKPDQDFGSSDYQDPEKYTEPPALPARRDSMVVDDEGDNDDEDYVSQGTSEPASDNEAGVDYMTLNPTGNTNSYVKSSAHQSSPTDNMTNKQPNSSDDYVSVDSPEQPTTLASSPSNDYVSVDSPEQPTALASSPSNDYVSADSPE